MSEAADSIVLEEEIDPNYNPSEEEVIEYAKWLGMDLVKDKDLFWLAREGLMAPLPQDWKPCRTKDTEDVYYFNFKTGESKWDHPCDDYYKKLYDEEKKKKELHIKEEGDTKKAQAKDDIRQILETRDPTPTKKDKKKKNLSYNESSLSSSSSHSTLSGGLAPVIGMKALPGLKMASPLGSIKGSSSSSSLSSSSTSFESNSAGNSSQYSLGKPALSSISKEIDIRSNNDNKMSIQTNNFDKDTTSEFTPPPRSSESKGRNFLEEAQQKALAYSSNISSSTDKNLRDQIEELESEKSRLLSKLSFNQVEINKSKEDLDSLTQRLNDSNKQKNELDLKVDSLNDEIISKNREIKRLTNDIMDKDDEIEHLKKKKNYSSQNDDKIEELEKEISNLKRDLDIQKKDYLDQLNEKSSEIKQIQSELSSKNDNILEKEQLLKQLNIQLDTANLENKDLLKKNNEVSNSIKSREIEIRELSKQVNDLTKKNKDLSSFSPLKDPIISSFETSSPKNPKSPLSSSVSDGNLADKAKFIELSSKIDDLNAQNTDLISKLNDFTSKNEELQIKHSAIQGELERIKNSTTLSDKESLLESKNSEISSKLNEATLKIESLIAQIKSIENKESEKIKDLEAKISEYLNHIEKLKEINTAQLTSNEAEKEAFRLNERKSLEDKIIELNATILESNGKMEKLNEQVNESSSELKKVQNEKETLINNMKLEFEKSLTQNKEFYEERIKSLNESHEEFKVNMDNINDNRYKEEDEYKAKLKDFQAKFMKFSEDKSSYESQINELNNSISNLKLNEKISENNINSNLIQIDSLKVEISNLKDFIKEKDSVINKLNDEVTQKKLIIAEKKDEVLKLKSEYNTEKIGIENEKFNLKLKEQDLIAEIEKEQLKSTDQNLLHSKELLLRDNEIKLLKEKNEKSIQSYNELLEVNNTYEKTIKNYQQAANTPTVENTTNSSKFNYLIRVKEDEISSLNKKNNELLSENIEFKSTILQLTSDNKDLVNSKNDYENKLNSINEKLNKKSTDDNENFINLLNSKESQLKEEHSTEIKNLESQISFLKNTIQSKEESYTKFKNILNENLNTQKNKTNELQLLLEKVTDEMSILKSDSDFNKNSLISYEEKLKKKDATVSNLSDKNLELKNTIINLTNEIEELKLISLCNNDPATNNVLELNSNGDYEAYYNNKKLILKNINEYNNMKHSYEKNISMLKEKLEKVSKIRNNNNENENFSNMSNSLSLISKNNDTNTINNDFFFTPTKNDDDFMNSLSEIYSEKKKINELTMDSEMNQEDLMSNLINILYNLTSATGELKLFSLHSNYHFKIIYQKVQKNSNLSSNILNTLNDNLSKRINFENIFFNQLEDLVNKKAKNFIKENRQKIVEQKKMYKNNSKNKNSLSSTHDEKEMINQLTNNINGVIRLVRFVQLHLESRKNKLESLKSNSDKLKRCSKNDEKFESTMSNLNHLFSTLESSLIQFNEEVTSMTKGLMNKDSKNVFSSNDILEPEPLLNNNQNNKHIQQINHLPPNYHPPYTSDSVPQFQTQNQQVMPYYYPPYPYHLPVPPNNQAIINPPSLIPTPITILDPKQIELQYLMQNNIQNYSKMHDKSNAFYYQIPSTMPSNLYTSYKRASNSNKPLLLEFQKSLKNYDNVIGKFLDEIDGRTQSNSDSLNLFKPKSSYVSILSPVKSSNDEFFI